MSKATDLAYQLQVQARTMRLSGRHDAVTQTHDEAEMMLIVLDASHRQLLEALDWCVAEINRESPSVINARTAIAAAKELT